ncbi:hypothetical protein DPMN_181611 [Dreissena polymorpha]|uniref:Uncharacterized protein n=1 Tax=Dreissena polymorpha TaxID=45954 RepID=A0A9D4I3V6_DREPO|nr:hypothetical protein DPMN_181611 [Dreissena polymorpha]
MCPEGLGDCLAQSGILLHDICPDGLGTILDCLGMSCRCITSLGNWHHRTLYWSLLQVPRRSLRLSGTVADCLGVSGRCPACLGDLMKLSQTVCDCPIGAQTILVPSQIVWESPGTGFGCRQSVKR